VQWRRWRAATAPIRPYDSTGLVDFVFGDVYENLSTLPIAVVVLHAQSNELHLLMPLVPDLGAALASLQSRRLVQVGA